MQVPPGWDVSWAFLPWPTTGLTSWRHHTITIDPICPPEMQRCTLAHELIHVERGPVLDEPTLAAREELAVEKETARRLIGVRELGEAMVESDRLGHVAELLGVDPDTLTVRLTHLHPVERAYLRQRLAAKEDSC